MPPTHGTEAPGEMADPTFGAREEQREPPDHLTFPGRTKGTCEKGTGAGPMGPSLALVGTLGPVVLTGAHGYVCSQ